MVQRDAAGHDVAPAILRAERDVVVARDGLHSLGLDQGHMAPVEMLLTWLGPGAHARVVAVADDAPPRFEVGRRELLHRRLGRRRDEDCGDRSHAEPSYVSTAKWYGSDRACATPPITMA